MILVRFSLRNLSAYFLTEKYHIPYKLKDYKNKIYAQKPIQIPHEPKFLALKNEPKTPGHIKILVNFRIEIGHT